MGPTEEVNHTHLRSFIFGWDHGLSLPHDVRVASFGRLDARAWILIVTVKLIMLGDIKPVIPHFKALRSHCYMLLRILQLGFMISLLKIELPANPKALIRMQISITLHWFRLRLVIAHLDKVTLAVVSVVPQVLLPRRISRCFTLVSRLD